MTPADKRVMDLLDRWLTSIELHLKYADLDDVSYQQMQPWPKHERPARWILELAQQKVLSLQTLCKRHRSDDDPSFAESMELMCFLANLVGAQHIQRFIPLALPEHETKPDTGMHRAMTTGSITARQSAASTPSPAQPRPAVATAVPAPPPPAAAVVRAPAPTPVPAPGKASTPTPAAAPAVPVAAIPTLHPKPAEEPDRTREMPRLRPARQRHQHVNKTVEPRRLHIKAAPAIKAQPADGQQDEVVIADAVRLLKWGRQWHEIAELIARMAERPSIGEVRKILRSHKPAIEQQLET